MQPKPFPICSHLLLLLDQRIKKDQLSAITNHCLQIYSTSYSKG